MKVVLLSIPALREKDVARMASLRELTAGGEIADLIPSFPAVTCSVQANMTTGRLPCEHGVVANGFYWRDKRQVEMWTSPADCIERPRIWDIVRQQAPGKTSAEWFPLHAKGSRADYACTPAPIHNPDGSESLWCYTRPSELYGELRDALGHFPLMHFWGPMANIKSTQWIADSAAIAARRWRPDFFYIYIPHLDYAAQRSGPDSAAADEAVMELDGVLGRLAAELAAAYGEEVLWVVAGEYAITPVSHVVYPNRLLREAGLLTVHEEGGREQIDFAASRAFALVDHQISHIFTDGKPETVGRVVQVFAQQQGIARVLSGKDLVEYGLSHPRSGEVVLASSPESWQAYYWWFDNERAPTYARSVDIHRKPGYDPVELFFDFATKTVPLDASLVRGSHGAMVESDGQKTVIVTSQPGLLPSHDRVRDTDVFELIVRQLTG